MTVESNSNLMFLSSHYIKILYQDLCFSCTGGKCKCRDKTKGDTHTIEKDCLPDPFHLLKYVVTVNKATWFRKWVVVGSVSKCISVVPKKFKDIAIR